MGFNRDVIRRRRDEMNAMGFGSGGPGGGPGCGAASSGSWKSPSR